MNIHFQLQSPAPSPAPKRCSAHLCQTTSAHQVSTKYWRVQGGQVTSVFCQPRVVVWCSGLMLSLVAKCYRENRSISLPAGTSSPGTLWASLQVQGKQQCVGGVMAIRAAHSQVMSNYSFSMCCSGFLRLFVVCGHTESSVNTSVTPVLWCQPSVDRILKRVGRQWPIFPVVFTVLLNNEAHEIRCSLAFYPVQTCVTNEAKYAVVHFKQIINLRRKSYLT